MANAGPRLIVVDGISYMWDRTRGKFLSQTRNYIRAGVNLNKAKNQSMRAEDGQAMLKVGDAMPRNGTIVGITLNTRSLATWTLEVRKRDSETPLALFPVVNKNQDSKNFNVDFNSGDVLQLYINGVDVPFPRGMIEIAWRY